MMSMIRCFYICLVALLVLSSCGRDDISGFGEEEPEPEFISTNFSFVDLEYVFIDNKTSYIKEITKKNYPIVINNNSDVVQSYIFHPQNNIYEISTFWSGDTRAFSFVDDQQKVKIPLNISENGNIEYDNGTRWIYSKIGQKLRPNIDSYRIIAIKPNHKLVLTSSFKLREVVTNYRLHLKGVEYNEDVFIDGRWGGAIFLDYDIEYTVDSIR